jgi:hypothetical protein
VVLIAIGFKTTGSLFAWFSELRAKEHEGLRASLLKPCVGFI